MDIRTQLRAFIYVKLTLDVTMILVLLVIFHAYTTKLQVVSEDISKQPQYNLEAMQTQMNDISKFIIEHKEFEGRHTSNADLLSKQIKEIQLNKLREPTNRKDYSVEHESSK